MQKVIPKLKIRQVDIHFNSRRQNKLNYRFEYNVTLTKNCAKLADISL